MTTAAISAGAKSRPATMYTVMNTTVGRPLSTIPRQPPIARSRMSPSARSSSPANASAATAASAESWSDGASSDEASSGEASCGSSSGAAGLCDCINYSVR